VAQLNLATHGLSAKLGDNSSNVIIQNSPDGKTNTTPLVLKFPQLHSGDDVWLTTSEGDDVTLFDSSGNGIPRGLGDGSDGWDLTTMAGTGTSLTVYVAATGGSANVNDIYFTLHDKPSGGTTVPIDSNRGTAVDLVVENSVGTQLSRYSAAPTTYEVGQIANWKAVVLSPFPAGATTSVSWTFPSGDNVDYRWSDGTPYPAASGPNTGGPIALAGTNAPGVGTAQPNISFFWVSAGGGATTSFVSEPTSIKVTAVCNGIPLSAIAKAVVSEPYADAQVSTNPPGSFAFPPPAARPRYIRYALWYLKKLGLAPPAGPQEAIGLLPATITPPNLAGNAFPAPPVLAPVTTYGELWTALNDLARTRAIASAVFAMRY